MKIKKTVTDKKLIANRNNAQKSTGPRTEQGKSIARFNSIKDGLFAQHIVIPRIDDPYTEEFPALLTALRDEFQPVGVIEEFYLGQMLHAMWKLRRARRCEKGSVQFDGLRETAIEGKHGLPFKRETSELEVLRLAQREFDLTGTLSRTAYQQVVPLLHEVHSKEFFKEDLTPDQISQIDNGFILPAGCDNFLSGAIQFAIGRKQLIVDRLTYLEESLISDYIGSIALPLENKMTSILRYEKAAMEQFESARKSLGECQANRQKNQVMKNTSPDRALIESRRTQ